MTSKDRRFFIVFTFIIIALSFVPTFIFFYYQFPSDTEFIEQFEKITIGEPHQNVIKLLGEPDGKYKEFRLGQYDGYEKQYEKAKNSNSEYYLCWFREIDLTYTIGFDKDNKVTIKSKGGT